MWNMLPGCWLTSGMGGMSRTGRGRERSRAEIAVVRVLEKRLGALPVVAEFGRRLRIAEIVDELCPVRPVAWITHGEVIEALVANRLTAPAPMLRVQDWAAAMAVEEAYGIAPELLNDDRIARALDAVAPQLEAITGGGGAAAVTEFGPFYGQSQTFNSQPTVQLSQLLGLAPQYSSITPGQATWGRSI